MEYITLGEKTFVKANKIARDLGYTSDYIGQLCRGGKVEAKLVGRTWYVEEGSIKDHKKNRYRSVKAVAQRELRQQVISDEAAQPVPLRKVADVGPKYAEHRSATVVTPRYAADDAELIPILRTKESVEIPEKRQKGKLNVGLADSEQIAIQSEQQKTEFEASELPEIRFKGDLTVTSADEVEPELEEPPVEPEIALEAEVDQELINKPSEDSVVVEVENEDSKASFAVEIRTLKTERDNRRRKQGKGHIPVIEEGGSVDVVVPIQTDIPVEVSVTEVPAEQVVEEGSDVYVWLVPLVLFVSCTALGLLVLSITQQIVVDETSVTKGYILDIHKTISELYLYFRLYLG